MRPNFVFRAPAYYRSPQLYRPQRYQNRALVLFDPATEQQVTIGTLSVLSPLYGNTPAVETGDYWIVPLVTSPGGYAITVNTDGTFSYDAAGDASRQQISTKAYDVSAGAFFATDEPGDYFTIYVNNSPPDELTPIPVQAWFTNIPITPVVLGDYVIDADDAEDLLTYTGSLPAGLSIADAVYNEGTPSARSVQQIEGTPTAVGAGGINLTVEDPPGDTLALTAISYTIEAGVLMPVLAGFTYEFGLETIFTLGLEAGPEPVIDLSSPIAPGLIVSTTPEAGTYVTPGSLVTFTVSREAEVREYAGSYWAARRARSRNAI